MLIKSDIRSSCRIVPGLSREQLDLCYKANDVTIAALDGLDLAVHECQLQVLLLAEHLVSITTHKPIENNNEISLVPVASMELFVTHKQKT